MSIHDGDADDRPAWRSRLEFAMLAGLSILWMALTVKGWIAQAAEVPIVTSGQRFVCTAVRVWDGDGPIWCAEGARIRLARINARELDGSCRPHAPCVQASGVAARDHLVELLGGARGRSSYGHVLIAPVRLACLSDGWGKGNRTAACCSLGGVDLSAKMVRDGYAARWDHPHPR